MPQIESVFDLADSIRVQRLKIGGISAAKLTYQMKVNEIIGTVKKENAQYLIIVDRKLIIVTFGTLSELSDEYEELFEIIAQSFEWLE